MYLVKKIIDKCEKSSADWRPGASGGRTMRIEIGRASCRERVLQVLCGCRWGGGQ